jgi:hypothetical protein
MDELNDLTIEISRSPFIGGNTMRRDVTADYIEQYHQMNARNATEEVMKWLEVSRPVLRRHSQAHRPRQPC